MSKDFELTLHFSKDTPEEIVKDLRTIADRIDKKIYVSGYDPVYSMSYPGDEEDDTDYCELCGSIMTDDNRCICQRGHMFCESHIINADQQLNDYELLDNLNCKYCPICDKEQHERDLKRCR